MKLSKLFKDDKYYFWTIMCIFLQVTAHDGDRDESFLTKLAGSSGSQQSENPLSTSGKNDDKGD